MQEIYKDITNYEGRYLISNLGNVKSLNNYNKAKPRVLKPDKDKRGYSRVKLHTNSNGVRFLVHRLVAAAFLDNPENKPLVNHIDNNPANNNLTNLEWCTQAENMAHSHKQGRQDAVIVSSAKAMAKANLARSKSKYDALVGVDLNGRILKSYFKKGKRYKGNFRCRNCNSLFTAELDSSLRGINRAKPLYCRSCSKKSKGKEIV